VSTIEDRKVYGLEGLAFTDTPLHDQVDRHSLIAEVAEIQRGVPHLTGEITAEESSVRLTTAAAYAQGQRIAFAPRWSSRYVAVHEVAHIVHYRAKLGGNSHGAEYRGIYAELVSLVYGDRYGRLLREVFIEAGLLIHPVSLGHLPKPIIDIDALAAATQEVRWL
jgi:hypothetical protein